VCGGGGDVPGQEFGDAIYRVVSDAREQLAQIGFRVESVQLRRSNQTIEYPDTNHHLQQVRVNRTGGGTPC